MKQTRIITIGTARQLLVPESREYTRAKLYAAQTSSLSTIVLTRKKHNFTEPIHDGNFHVYPTNSICRPLMLWDAFRIGVRLVQVEKVKGACIISSQDPLEVGWLVWLVARVTKIPFHIQVHGDYWSTSAWCESSPLRYIRRYAALILLRQTPAIRVVSGRVKQSLVIRGIKEQRITILPIRPEIEAFLSAKRPERKNGTCTFLSLGRLAPEKDIPRIVRAFAILVQKYPTYRLRIVGEGGEKKDIKKLIDSLGLTKSVSLVPWSDNVPQEIAAADIFLLASQHEAYALTLIESLATGTPVITTDVGCVGDVVKDHIHGLVVHEDGDMPFALAMEQLATDTTLQILFGTEGKRLAAALASESSETYAHTWVTSVETALRPI